MLARELKPGDVFVEVGDVEWAELPAKDKKKAKRITVERLIGVCAARNSGRIHLRTSAGDWCIPEIAPVTVLYTKSVPSTVSKGAAA